MAGWCLMAASAQRGYLAPWDLTTYILQTDIFHRRGMHLAKSTNAADEIYKEQEYIITAHRLIHVQDYIGKWTYSLLANMANAANITCILMTIQNFYNTWTDRWKVVTCRDGCHIPMKTIDNNKWSITCVRSLSFHDHHHQALHPYNHEQSVQGVHTCNIQSHHPVHSKYNMYGPVSKCQWKTIV